MYQEQHETEINMLALKNKKKASLFNKEYFRRQYIKKKIH